MKDAEGTIFDLEELEEGGQLTEREERFRKEYKQNQRRARAAITVVAVLLAVGFIVSFVIGRYALSPGRTTTKHGGNRAAKTVEF